MVFQYAVVNWAWSSTHHHARSLIKQEQLQILIFLVVTLFVLSTFINNKKVIGLLPLLSALGTHQVEYMFNGGVRYGWLYTFLIAGLMIITAKYICNKLGKIAKETDRVMITKLEMAMELSLLVVGVSMMSLVTVRLLRPISFLFFILIAKWKEYKANWSKENLLFLIICIAAVFAYMQIFNNVIFSYKETIFEVEKGRPFWIKDYYID